MGVNLLNKYQKLFFSKSEKLCIKIVKFEVKNLKMKICVQILKLIKNKSFKIILYTKIVWHWGMDGWIDGWVDGWVVEPGFGLLTAKKISQVVPAIMLYPTRFCIQQDLTFFRYLDKYTLVLNYPTSFSKEFLRQQP